MNLIAKYTKKPVTIEAIQFADDADTISNIHGFLKADTTCVSYENTEAPVLKIETLEGVMTAQVGDYIIKGVKGEFYPCKPDIFGTTYQKGDSHSEPLDAIGDTKQFRKDLDNVLQRLKTSSHPTNPHEHARASRERSLSVTKLQEAIMWLGMDLKAINDESPSDATANPYPQSYNPESPVIEPTADGLKL